MASLLVLPLSRKYQHISLKMMQAGVCRFDVWRLKAGESITLPSDERERCLVLVAGLASVKRRQFFLSDWSAHESV